MEEQWRNSGITVNKSWKGGGEVGWWRRGGMVEERWDDGGEVG